MKQLYVCEKCGATFDTWEDAVACENRHGDIPRALYGEYEYVDKAAAKHNVWGAQDVVPRRTIAVCDTDGGAVYAVYKLERVLNDDERKQLESEGEEIKREDKELWERIRKRNEAKEAEAV